MNLPTRLTPIIKLTSDCNYNCSFCRYANHRIRESEMSLSMVKSIIEQTVKYNKAHKQLVTKFIFHGGEPTLWGLENFYSIIEFQKKIINELDIRIINSIQTNGSLIDEHWAKFFKDSHFQVGISLDGPISLNYHIGKEGPRLSLHNLMSNIEVLKKNKVSFGVLSVITKNHMSNAKLFYDFLVDNKIRNIGLTYCYNPKDEYLVEPVELGGFLKELFDYYFQGKEELNIREFNNAIRKFYKGSNSACSSSCRESCGTFITIDYLGDISFCDDYDLDKVNIIGNLNKTEIKDMLLQKRYQEIYSNNKRIISVKCKECDASDLCGTGCPRNDIENGEDNYFCETYKMLYSHVQRKLTSYNMDT